MRQIEVSSGIPVLINPVRKALTSALFYISFCTLYIWLSGTVAESLASDQSQLMQIEALKGTLFVLVTGGLYFGVSLLRWKRIRAHEEVIVKQQQLLLQNERKAVAGMYAASMAHDLRNVLMTVYGLMEDLKAQGESGGHVSSMRKNAETAIGSLKQFTERLTATATEGLPKNRELANISEVIENTLTLVRKHQDARYCRVTLQADKEIVTPINRPLLEDAITNLVVNGAQASGVTGHVEIRLIKSSDEVVLEAHDNGPGVPEDLKSHIFDACFTTKPSGSGLGLMSIKSFAHAHGGSVSVGDSDLGGAVFRIRFPINQQEQADRNREMSRAKES